MKIVRDFSLLSSLHTYVCNPNIYKHTWRYTYAIPLYRTNRFPSTTSKPLPSHMFKHFLRWNLQTNLLCIVIVKYICVRERSIIKCHAYSYISLVSNSGYFSKERNGKMRIHTYIHTITCRKYNFVWCSEPKVWLFLFFPFRKENELEEKICTVSKQSTRIFSFHELKLTYT